ncbi:metallopeptidase [Cordyceps javanica]|uniref:Metallopeptidase n=1 Tax=Cordyceps javanica TaxID=43265 RepID=A0A545VA24_9HYPO|nr:metallopeptidase [Cordyceps javanica]TQW09774.1 SprT-like family protein [Cordyceps javanica]
MAFWVLGAGAGGPPDNSHTWHPQHQDNPSYDDYGGKAFQPPFDQDQIFHHQNANRNSYDTQHHFHSANSYSTKQAAPSIHIKNLAFLVIREQHPDSPPPEACDLRSAPSSGSGSGNDNSFPSAPLPQRPVPLERTESGLPISDTPAHEDEDEDNEHGGCFLDDLAAAQLVRDHVASFQRRCPDSQSGRILRALINPKNERRRPSSRSRSRHRRQQDMSHRHSDGPRTTSSSSAFPLDNDALRSVFSAANELFFANRLARRVAWDWSHPGSAQYQSAVVGTTALRRCAHLGGWETLIVLSSPVLRDTRYNRRLLLSTFLHEMIHSFLFVTCGRKAGRQGGHTEGFRQIAEVIDAWVGKDYLRLSDMQADLQYFEDGTPVPATPCMGYRQMTHDHGGGGGQESAQRAAIPAWQLDNERNVWPYPAGGEGAGHSMPLNEPVMPPPQQFRHPDDGAWQWYEREGFETRDGPVLGMHY